MCPQTFIRAIVAHASLLFYRARLRGTPLCREGILVCWVDDHSSVSASQYHVYEHTFRRCKSNRLCRSNSQYVLPVLSADLISFLSAGDEADSIATAPALAKVDNVYPLIRPDTFDKKKDFDVLQQWGNLAPWQSVKSLGLPDASPQIPSQCKLSQVHLLHRHGARYPTSGDSPAAFAAALHEAATSPAGVSFTGPLQFLNTW